MRFASTKELSSEDEIPTSYSSKEFSALGLHFGNVENDLPTYDACELW